jgi:Peptidase family M13
MEDSNQNLMRRILESPYDETTSLVGDLKMIDKSNFNKMQLAYSSCMNEDAAKASGMASLQNILAAFEKQYPVAAPPGSSKVGSKEELTNVLIWLAQHMFSELVSVTILVSFMFIRAVRNWLTRVTSTDQSNKSSRSRDIYLWRRRCRSFQRRFQEFGDDKQL